MKKFSSLLKESKGFSLLEVLFAIFILVVGVVGAYSAFGGMIASSSIIGQKLTAAYLAQEGIEIARNIRDTKWLNSTATTGWADTKAYFFNCQGQSDNSSLTGYSGGCEADYLTGTGAEGSDHILNPISSLSLSRILYISSSNNSYNYTNVGTPSIFKRQIIVNPKTITGEPTSNILDVIVNVYWKDRGINYNFPLEGFLYNWDE